MMGTSDDEIQARVNRVRDTAQERLRGVVRPNGCTYVLIIADRQSASEGQLMMAMTGDIPRALIYDFLVLVAANLPADAGGEGTGVLQIMPEEGGA